MIRRRVVGLCSATLQRGIFRGNVARHASDLGTTNRDATLKGGSTFDSTSGCGVYVAPRFSVASLPCFLASTPAPLDTIAYSINDPIRFVGVL